ncbi:MAG: hypothetical protein NTV02_03085 [Candidatus Zambryskibacteria bacterium]|nr:hypothetical protein [Candidatus Zambryskibacteria bacterium]
MDIVKRAKRKLGKLIKTLRLAAKLSIGDLAEMCGVEDYVVFRLQCATGKNDEHLVIWKILDVLGVTCQEVRLMVHGYLKTITEPPRKMNIRSEMA